VTDDRVARAALTRLVEPASGRVASLLERLGAPELYRQLRHERIDRGLSTDAAGRAVDIDPERDLERAAARGIRFVVPGDAEWPEQLDDLGHGVEVSGMQGRPFGLWVRGPVRLDSLRRSVAVVGSRSATTYGEDVARGIGAGLARDDRPVVSGAAFGIDQAAHRGALALRGPSVAVLACGVDRAYPAAHRDLLEHHAQHGAVVSELPPGCAPMRMRFLARNRLIAALSCGTVLVEAATRSGALNTAAWTEGLSRPLMGVPGSVTSAQSQGVHHWIRSGAAMLVTGAPDVLEVVGGSGEHLREEPREPARPQDRLPRRHQQVLDAVPVHRAASVESVARTAGIGPDDTLSALRTLLRHRLVEQVPTGWRLGEAARRVPDEPLPST
jgi:DNA processing protein